MVIASVIILSRKMLKRPLSDSDCGSEPVSYAIIKVDCTSGLVVKVFNDLDQVGINVMLSKVGGCRQKPPPTWLVSAGYSAWHFFPDGVLKINYPCTGRLV